MKKLTILPLIFASLAIQLFGQSSGELYETIARMDSSYFAAQNNCDLKKYESFLAKDFEFYHDKVGLTPSLKNEMVDMAIFCGEQRKRQPLRREMTEGTLRVYPINDYGALEFCDHVFYLQISDGTEKLVGRGKMTAIWKLENDQWKLARIISYDHQPLSEVELEDNILDLYVGNYELPGRIVNIKKEGHLLRVTDIQNGEKGWTKELFPESENVFYLNYENVQYEFLKDGTTEIVKLVIYENGKKIEEASKMD
jgi:ketosteroid isomerase-like protein